MALEPSGNFQLQQHHAHDPRRNSARGGSGRRSRPAIGLSSDRRRACARRQRVRSPARARRRPDPVRELTVNADDRLQHGDDVSGFGHRRCALFDQAVGALRARIERRARYRKHFAALFEREPRRDQRAERLAASTMTTPSDSPEIRRLRRGKSRARGSQPNGISVSATPAGKMASSKSACSGG